MSIKIPYLTKSVAVSVVSGVVMASCAAPDPDAAFRELSQTMVGRIPDAVVWRTGGPEDVAIDQRVNNLLSEPLTARSAVQLAFLKNRDLQAQYAALGIAQAELVQASLLQNPIFEVMVRPSTEQAPSSAKIGGSRV